MWASARWRLALVTMSRTVPGGCDTHAGGNHSAVLPYSIVLH
jgi:hypothetical protein